MVGKVGFLQPMSLLSKQQAFLLLLIQSTCSNACSKRRSRLRFNSSNRELSNLFLHMVSSQTPLLLFSSNSSVRARIKAIRLLPAVSLVLLPSFLAVSVLLLPLVSALVPMIHSRDWTRLPRPCLLCKVHSLRFLNRPVNMLLQQWHQPRDPSHLSELLLLCDLSRLSELLLCKQSLLLRRATTTQLLP